MKIISKKISLEPYKSRINGSLTSYNGDEIETFYDYNIKSNINNYGMFPYDVIYNGKVLSYPTLMKRYYFCKRYKEMLKYDNCEDGGYYTNAVTYYTHNFKYNIESLKQEYTNLDNTYIEYGGDDFLNWCKNILYGGAADYSETAHILIPILFTNTIDDLGEFSIFCDEWEEGIEYKKGDIVLYDDNVWVKKITDSEKYGSIYSNRYKELYFPELGKEISYEDSSIKEHMFFNNADYEWYVKSNITSGSQWDNNTDIYFDSSKTKNDYTSNIIPNNTKYSVRNGKIYYNATPINMSYKYNIITNEKGFFPIDNEIYEPSECEYIEYDSKIILVYKSINFIQLNEKYCLIDGNKLFSFTNESNPNSHYFVINNIKYDVKKDWLITYNGNGFKINANTVTLYKMSYPKIEGYSVINGKKYYISNNKIVTLKRGNDEGTLFTLNEDAITDLGKYYSTSEEINNTTSGYTISDNMVCVFKPYNEYSVSGMSGYTESKLSSLRTYGLAFDDMGNELPGCLQTSGSGENMIYIQPTENSYLDLPYKVGNVSELTPFEDENGEIEAYFGNIIISMSLYYVNFYDRMIKETEIVCGFNDSILEKIKECNNKLDNFKTSHSNDNYINDNHYSIKSDIRCKIKYHMGAMINTDKKSIINNNSGVTYEEEVTLIDDIFEYKLDDISSFIIHYYKIEYMESFDVLNEYSNTYTKVGKSYFSYQIEDLLKSSQNKFRTKHDDLIYSPMIREEYKIGSSSLENIESNIYIDRGFSASFERHLKLLDIKSMESLENYGNGFFNIIES